MVSGARAGLRSGVSVLVQLLVSGALLAVVLQKVPLARLWGGASRVPLWAWATGVLLTLLFMLVEAARTVLCARLLDKRLGFWIAFQMNVVAGLYGFLFFGWIGGGGYRLWRLSALGFTAGEGVAVMLVDRGAVLAATIVVFAGLLLVAAAVPAPVAPVVVWGAVSLMLPLGVWALYSLRIRLAQQAVPKHEPRTRWERLSTMARLVLAGGWGAPAAFLSLGVLGLAPSFAWVAALARIFGINAPGPELWSGIAAMGLAQQIPVSFSGIGLREYGYQWLFERWGGDPAGGAVVGGVQSMLIFVSVALGALLRLWPVRDGGEVGR